MSMAKNAFDKFTELMDQNIKGVQYGVYCVAGVGLIFALRSIKPFTKFCKPADIPDAFMKKKMKFYGQILQVDQGKHPKLIVDHQPIVSIGMHSRNKTGLPMRIISVDVTHNGGIWLNSLLKGTTISFIPLRVDHEAAHCIVHRNNQDIGQRLLSIGFASVGEYNMSLDKDPIYAKYYEDLLRAQKMAERKGEGMWQERNSGLLSNILRKIGGLRYSFS